MISLVISGGQTGADQAGWRSARKANIACSGWMPKGYLTEDGPRPEFAELYGAKEHSSAAYPPRTQRNVSDSDATVFFGHNSSGYGATFWAAVSSQKPFYWHDTTDTDFCVEDFVEWLAEHKVRTLNVAGNRESSSPGIGAWVEAYLDEVFRLVKESQD